MKKIQGELIGMIKRGCPGVITKLLFISLLLGVGLTTTYAAGTDKKPPSKIVVEVTEKVPGAECIEAEGSKPEFPLYKCTIEGGTTGVIKLMGQMIKYFAYIATLVGVLFIVYNGIMYSMGGADASLKDEAKKKIVGTIIGLAVLFLSGAILNILAPWVYK